MAQLYLDQSGINRYVKNGLSSSIEDLRGATSYSSILSIPYDFVYRTYLKGLYSALNKDYTKAKEVNNKITSAINNLNIINSNAYGVLTSISNYKVTKRLPAIK